MNAPDQFSAVLLGAGNSIRMGISKPLLISRQGTTFFENCVNAFLKFGCREVIAVVNNEIINQLNIKNLQFPDNVSLIKNDHPEFGRFFSLKKGLEEIRQGRYIFFHNADNPCISGEVLTAIASNRQNADVICPVYQNKRGHPVLISQGLAKKILSEKSRSLHLRDYLKRFSSYDVEVLDNCIHLNINTPDEYRAYLSASEAS